MSEASQRPPALDPFGFPLSWSIHTRREIRRVGKAFDALSAEDRERFADGRRAADLAVAERPQAGATDHSMTAAGRRVVVVLPFPIETGGMRVQVQLARMMAAAGAEVHIRQVRGDDCLDGKYDDFGFASRGAIGADPRKLTDSLRELGPATMLVGCWIDYFAALESGIGPVIGYSAGEPTLKETEPFDQPFLDFAHRMHQLPVTLWAGSRFIQGVYRDRFGRAAKLVSVPIAGEMFDQDVEPRPQPPYRLVLIGPEHLTTKGIPGALEALAPLREDGFEIVWISPQQPSPGLAALVDELHLDLDAKGVARVVGSCHGLVFPSRLEGLGNPPLEAMALGVPSVLCPNGGSQEYAVPEENCLQVPYGDAESLRSAVRRLRDDPELTERLRHNGFETVERYRPATIQRTVRDFLVERFEELPFVPASVS